MAQNIIYSPWEGTKGPWLCLLTTLLLFSLLRLFSLVSAFLASLIKLILWLQFSTGKRQAEDVVRQPGSYSTAPFQWHWRFILTLGQVCTVGVTGFGSLCKLQNWCSQEWWLLWLEKAELDVELRWSQYRVLSSKCRIRLLLGMWPDVENSSYCHSILSSCQLICILNLATINSDIFILFIEVQKREMIKLTRDFRTPSPSEIRSLSLQYSKTVYYKYSVTMDIIPCLAISSMLGGSEFGPCIHMYIFPPEGQVSCQLPLPVVGSLKGFPHLSPQSWQKTLLPLLSLSWMQADTCGHGTFLLGGTELCVKTHGGFFANEPFSWQRGFIPPSFPASFFYFSLFKLGGDHHGRCDTWISFVHIRFEDDQHFTSPSSWYWNCYYFIYFWLLNFLFFNFYFILAPS